MSVNSQTVLNIHDNRKGLTIPYDLIVGIVKGLQHGVPESSSFVVRLDRCRHGSGIPLPISALRVLSKALRQNQLKGAIPTLSSIVHRLLTRWLSDHDSVLLILISLLLIAEICNNYFSFVVKCRKDVKLIK